MNPVQTSIQRQLLTLGVLVLGGGIIGSLLAEGILQLNGMSTLQLASENKLSESFTASQRLWLRIGLMFNHGMMFLGAGLMFGYIFYRHSFGQYLSAFHLPSVKKISIWLLIVLISYPAVAYLTVINESIDLPSWASSAQNDNLNLLKSILRMEHFGELLITLILVGLLPALGEELVFRGILQKKLIEWFSSPHLAIGIAALLFGLVHGQLGRLLPLSFLGLLIGYSYYLTNSFWVPVVIHFLNNSLQVILLYAAGSTALDTVTDTPQISPWLSLASFILTFVLLYHQVTLSIDERRP